MKIETIAEMEYKLASGQRVIHELVRIDGQLAENRVVIIGMDIARALLIPIKDSDIPAVRAAYGVECLATQ